MYSYVLCGVFGCWELFEAQHQHTECPKCGVSRAEIIAYKTIDLNVINSKKIDKEIDNFYNDGGLGG